MYEDPYKVLKINRDATLEEVKKAYKNLAKKYHPDVCKDPDANEKMARINKAYKVLEEQFARKTDEGAGHKCSNVGTEETHSDSKGNQSQNKDRYAQTATTESYNRGGRNKGTKQHGRNGGVYFNYTTPKQEIDSDALRKFGTFSPVYKGEFEFPNFYPKTHILTMKKTRGMSVNFMAYLVIGLYETLHCALFWLFSLNPRTARMRMNIFITTFIVVRVSAFTVEKQYADLILSISGTVFMFLIIFRLMYLIYFGVYKICKAVLSLFDRGN